MKPNDTEAPFQTQGKSSVARSSPRAEEEVFPSSQVDQEMYSETDPNKAGFYPDVLQASPACAVRVALCVRPLLPRELLDNPRVCLEITEDEQAVIGKDRSFTFDRSFDSAHS